jgi:hypothetical protein
MGAQVPVFGIYKASMFFNGLKSAMGGAGGEGDDDGDKKSKKQLKAEAQQAKMQNQGRPGQRLVRQQYRS